MQVVIIGAGTAALSAAARLSQHAHINVVILEATDRIGGRIKPSQLNGQTIDLGASWMHETRYNPLFDAALRLNWPMKYTDLVHKMFTNKGAVPADAGVAPILDDLNNRIVEKFHGDFAPPARNEPSMLRFIEAELESMPLTTARQRELARLMIQEYEHFVGLPLDQFPAGDAGATTSQGRDAFVLGQGYQYVIEWLKQQINWDRTSVGLESPVVQINAGTDSKSAHAHHPRYAVHFQPPNLPPQTVTADYVLCTIPIGALKHGFDSIFGGLELESLAMVRETVQATDVASLGKIVVEFAEPFWDTRTNVFFVAHEENGRSLSFVNPFGNNVLMVLTGPPLTAQVEADPTNARQYFEWGLPAIAVPGKEISAIKSVQVTDWTQSPYFRCSYSARALGQSYDELVYGYVNNEGPIRFAGEHTILEGNGCVHGAYASGLREADRILEMIRER